MENWITLAIYFGAFILIFYLFIILPRKKQEKKHGELLGGLKKGDKVVSIGGIKGEITKIKEDTMILKVCGGAEIELLKKAIAYKDEDE